MNNLGIFTLPGDLPAETNGGNDYNPVDPLPGEIATTTATSTPIMEATATDPAPATTPKAINWPLVLGVVAVLYFLNKKRK